MPSIKTILAVSAGVVAAPYVRDALKIQPDPTGFGVDDVVLIGAVVVALWIAHR